MANIERKNNQADKPEGMKWKKGGNQGPVERGVQKTGGLVIFDLTHIKRIKEVEEPRKPANRDSGEKVFSLRAGK